MQLASKIPDTQVQLWATALLKGNIETLFCLQRMALTHEHDPQISTVQPMLANKRQFRCIINSPKFCTLIKLQHFKHLSTTILT